MAKIAYIMLCHKDPEAIIRQAERMTAVGDYMSIHFDASASKSDYKKIVAALQTNPNVTFARRRVRCGWGEWSLVNATLLALEAAVKEFKRATHFYMLSGDCMPIKTAQYIHQYLDDHDKDFIESFDFFESNWIKTGLKEERLIYRHFFNEREQKRLFFASYFVQRHLGLKRSIPSDLRIQIGSQWWCLRRESIEKILRFIKKRRDVVRFFRLTWIPDETFFQTLVRHLVPSEQIETRTLTFLVFSDYGMPATFYNDHYDLLLSQDFMFARKISPGANDLKRKLGSLYAASDVDFQISNEGRSLFNFLTQRGRVGRRFATRFWETESTLGRKRELLIILCKKWHVGKRLAEAISSDARAPHIGYLFDEENTPLPHLGGIEKTLTKRTRHRRALVRMIFDSYKTDRLLICIDPRNLDLLKDFTGDRANIRILEVDCQFSEDYLIGHAMRTGLAGERTPKESLNRMLPTIKNDIIFEQDSLRDEQFENYAILSETGLKDENTKAVAQFLQISQKKAAEIVGDKSFFAD